MGGVASAAGSDARSRDEGDRPRGFGGPEGPLSALVHRGGAATPQTAPRDFRLRRSRCDRQPRDFKGPRRTGPGLDSLGRRSRSERLRPTARHDTRIHFSAPCYTPKARGEEWSWPSKSNPSRCGGAKSRTGLARSPRRSSRSPARARTCRSSWVTASRAGKTTAILELYPVSGKKAATAAGAAGLSASTIPTLLVEGDNKPGIGHAMARAIADAGINIELPRRADDRQEVLRGFRLRDGSRREDSGRAHKESQAAREEVRS